MNRPSSPCGGCKRKGTCDDLDDVCKKYRRWLARVWPRITTRAAIGLAALHLYRAGQNDRQISDAIGVSQPAVCQWRKRNDLPPNGKRGRPESEAPTC